MIVRTIKSARAKAPADMARTQDDPGLSKRPTTSWNRKDNGMSRTSLLLAAFSLAVGMTGCTHCDTCDDFPTPCTGPNCGFRGGPVGGAVSTPDRRSSPAHPRPSRWPRAPPPRRPIRRPPHRPCPSPPPRPPPPSRRRVPSPSPLAGRDEPPHTHEPGRFRQPDPLTDARAVASFPLISSPIPGRPDSRLPNRGGPFPSTFGPTNPRRVEIADDRPPRRLRQGLCGSPPDIGKGRWYWRLIKRLRWDLSDLQSGDERNRVLHQPHHER